MEEYPLIRLRQAECITNLLRAPTLDVAQAEDCALRRWKLLDRLGQLASRLRGQQTILRPRLRRKGPVSGPARVVRAAEALGLERSLGDAGRLELGKGDRPPLAVRLRLGPVGQDAEDPGLQRGAALEAVDPAEDRLPGLLHDLLGGRAARH